MSGLLFILSVLLMIIATALMVAKEKPWIKRAWKNLRPMTKYFMFLSALFYVMIWITETSSHGEASYGKISVKVLSRSLLDAYAIEGA